MTTEPMSRPERKDLAEMVRRRERLEKTMVKQRAAELIADIEEKLAAQFAADDARWADVTKAASEAIKGYEAELARRCDEIGIPAEFRPSLYLSWSSRGQNGDRERRAELRKVAHSRIAAIADAARTQVEQRSVRLQEQLLSGGLTSEEAVAFFNALPPVGDLMPALDVGDVEGEARRLLGKGGNRWHGFGNPTL